MTVPTKHTLLVVDDEPDVCDSVHDLLRREFRVLKARSAAEGYNLMASNEVHIIMTDQRMPQVTGVEMLSAIRQGHPTAVRMLFTGYADLDSIIQAINQGHIFQFLKKPWKPEELETAVREAAKESLLSEIDAGQLLVFRPGEAASFLPLKLPKNQPESYRARVPQSIFLLASDCGRLKRILRSKICPLGQ